MKHKLRIEELSVASFSTDEDGSTGQRGTVRGMEPDPSYTQAFESCVVLETCETDCRSLVRTCMDTCAATCTCNVTCRRTCDFTCDVTCTG